MSHHQIRILLWWLAAMFFITSGWVVDHFVIHGSLASTDSSQSNRSGAADFTRPTQEAPPSRPKLAEKDFIYIWEKRLRRPLEDPPPPKPVAPVPEIVVPPIRLPEITLAATFVEDNGQASRAWLILPGGLRKLVTVGQALEDLAGQPVVTQIEDRRVTIQWGDNELVKELPADVSKAFENL